MFGRKHTELTDEELIRAFRADGDTLWLGCLLQRYTTLLFGVALKYLKDKQLAEDAVQQVFLKALTHFPKEDIGNFKGWLYILTRNYCLQQLRDRQRNADETVLAQIQAEPDDREALFLREHSIDALHEAIAELGEEQRQAISLFYLKRCSYEQIIAQTGFTFMQVKSFIQNGKRNLKIILMRKTGTRRP